MKAMVGLPAFWIATVRNEISSLVNDVGTAPWSGSTGITANFEG